MKILCLILSIILILSATGCNSAETGTMAQNTESTSQVSEAASISEQSISSQQENSNDTFEIPEQIEKIDYVEELPDEIKGKNIVESWQMTEPAYNPSLENILKYYADQVLGTIIDVEYVSQKTEYSANAWTIMHVRVDEALVGDYEQGQILKIACIGGYIPYRDTLANGTKKGMTDEEIDNTVMYQISEFTVKTNIGDQFVFIFTDDCVFGYPDTYRLTMGKYGQLLVLPDGLLFKEPTYDEKRTTYTFEEYKKMLEPIIANRENSSVGN